MRFDFKDSSSAASSRGSRVAPLRPTQASQTGGKTGGKADSKASGGSAASRSGAEAGRGSDERCGGLYFVTKFSREVCFAKWHDFVCNFWFAPFTK